MCLRLRFCCFITLFNFVASFPFYVDLCDNVRVMHCCVVFFICCLYPGRPSRARRPAAQLIQMHD